MKLRLRENSMRLRLLRGEMDSLRESGAVAETITFGPGAELVYVVRISPGATDLNASISDNRITVEIPEEAAAEWLSTDLVGLEREQRSGGSKPLSIQIEKDFACLDRRDDPDNHDAFPHPRSKC